MSQRVVLIGPRRSGKTTVGRLLAEVLGISFVDTDEWMEARLRRTPADIIKTDGEARFRELERECVRELAESMAEGVLATGGGAPLDRESAAMLCSLGPVVYLRAGVSVLLERLLEDPNAQARPVLMGSTPEEDTRLLYAARDPAYRRLATHVVSADSNAEDVCDAIVRCLRGPGPSRAKTKTEDR